VILDVRTIFMMLLISTVLMTVTLAVGVRSGRAHGVGKWILGLGLIALAWTMIAARDALPPLVGKGIADAVMLTGLCLHIAALIEFGGTTAPRWLLYAPGPLLFVAILPVLDHFAAFSVLVSSAFAAALLGIGFFAMRAGHDGAGPARWMMAIFYSVGAISLLVRAFGIWLQPAGHPNVFTGSVIQSITFVIQFAMTITGSFGFLVLQRERAEAEIRHLAMFDPLTELFNRRAFVDLAERELARTRRAGSPCAVLMLDLDHFKRVNDEFGHQAGDRVLVDFAAAARRSVRTGDLVGRYGGEEFCAVLPGADMPRALEIGERIRAAVALRPLGNLPRATTVSVGAAVCSGSADASLDGAIARADEALYAAKSQGRNRVASLELDARKIPTSMAAPSQPVDRHLPMSGPAPDRQTVPIANGY
jgi:diguanylate cyclase (GGDEF)-like protein